MTSAALTAFPSRSHLFMALATAPFGCPPSADSLRYSCFGGAVTRPVAHAADKDPSQPSAAAVLSRRASADDHRRAPPGSLAIATGASPRVCEIKGSRGGGFPAGELGLLGFMGNLGRALLISTIYKLALPLHWPIRFLSNTQFYESTCIIPLHLFLQKYSSCFLLNFPTSFKIYDNNFTCRFFHDKFSGDASDEYFLRG